MNKIMTIIFYTLVCLILLIGICGSIYKNVYIVCTCIVLEILLAILLLIFGKRDNNR